MGVVEQALADTMPPVSMKSRSVRGRGLSGQGGLVADGPVASSGSARSVTFISRTHRALTPLLDPAGTGPLTACEELTYR